MVLNFRLVALAYKSCSSIRPITFVPLEILNRSHIWTSTWILILCEQSVPGNPDMARVRTHRRPKKKQKTAIVSPDAVEVVDEEDDHDDTSDHPDDNESQEEFITVVILDR
jgi:hypothetical protein